jgi:DNA polymerase I-like protein with 3'-5' exonuclease and polymerase domains
MKCVANIEFTGIPIDKELFTRIKNKWEAIKETLIKEVDKDFGVFEGTVFKQDRFAAFVDKKGYSWKKSPSGAYVTEKEYFKERAALYPEIEPLYELKTKLSQLRVEKLFIGSDGRNHSSLLPYSSKTARNQPSSTGYIFSNASWLRHLIKPTEGMAVAYLDYSFQEVAIAAALSNDKNLKEDCLSGDVYLKFGKSIGLIPYNGTKITHKKERDLCKKCFLATNYGQSVFGFSQTASITEEEAKRIIRFHKNRYSDFYLWQQTFLLNVGFKGYASTTTDWRLYGEFGNPRTLMNFPMQASGSEILRFATILCSQEGIKIVALVHDALMIESPIEDIDKDVETAKSCMVEAGQILLNFPLKVSVDQVVKYPDRYLDKKGEYMWNKVLEIEQEIGGKKMLNSEETYILDAKSIYKNEKSEAITAFLVEAYENGNY